MIAKGKSKQNLHYNTGIGLLLIILSQLCGSINTGTFMNISLSLHINFQKA